jgi:hypothetical protein
MHACLCGVVCVSMRTYMCGVVCVSMRTVHAHCPCALSMRTVLVLSIETQHWSRTLHVSLAHATPATMMGLSPDISGSSEVHACSSMFRE